MSAFEQRLAEDGRVQSAITWIRQSGLHPAFLPDRLMVYAANGAVRAELLDADEIIRFARRLSPAHAPGEQTAADEASASASELRDLRETIRYLRDRWHLAIARSDEWEKRARAAEQALRELGEPAGRQQEPRYQQLRRFIAQELHPDGAPGPPDAREMKSDLFKAIWAEVSRLDKL